MLVIHQKPKVNQYHHKTNYIIYGSILSLFTISLLIAVPLTSSSASAATTHSSTASVTVSESCSMTVNVDAAHTATIPNGTYTHDIGQTTIKSFCNDPNGYAIYAIGYTGGDAGISAGTNTVLHSDSLGATYDIPTGTATSAGSTDISNWAMKLSAVTTASSGTTQPYAPSILSDTNGSYANYHIVPSSYTKVASFNNMTDNKGGVGSSLTTTYAAYISSTQPAGTYEGQVKYILVHPSSHLNPDILYMQEVDQWADTLTEIKQEVTAYDTRDNKSYTVARLCMEGYNASTGACESSMLWMTQNLDLDLSNSKPLNSINTDLNTYGSNAIASATGYSVDSNGTIYWTPASTANTIQFEGGTGTTVSGWTDDNNAPYSASAYYDSAGNDVYILSSGSDAADTVTNLDGCINAGNSEAECQHYKTGNYYNFAAANATNSVAGTVGHEITNADNYTAMPNSICPAGWRLPHGLLGEPTSGVASNNNSEFDTLLYTYGATPLTGVALDQSVSFAGDGFAIVRTAPFYLLRSGVTVAGGLFNRGTVGLSWSSTISNASRGYALGFESAATIAPAASHYRSYGFPVRCIARQ